jgi:hypothetical protein
MFGGRARAPQRRHLAFDAAGKMPALPVFSSVIEAESFPDKIKMKSVARRDGRVAEGARLESVYTFTGIGGSNPSLSARFSNVEGDYPLNSRSAILSGLVSADST